MTYPQVLLVPLLMLVDYYLTLLGATQREQAYSQHYKVQHYELNPLWQTDVAAQRWFNPRHVVLVTVLSALLVLAVELVPLPPPFVQAALGCILTAYGYIVARHVTNLLGFRHLIGNPGEVSGQVTMAPPYTLAMSLYHCVGMTLPVALIAAFSTSWFAYGGAVGMLLLVGVHYLWLWRARHKQAPPAAASAGSGPGRGKERSP